MADVGMTDFENTDAASPAKVPVPMLSSNDLMTLAGAWARGDVFSSAHLTKETWHLLPRIFLPVLTGWLTQLQPETLGMIYEFRYRALPTVIDGYPVFPCMTVLHKEQLDPLWNMVQHLDAAAKKAQAELPLILGMSSLTKH